MPQHQTTFDVAYQDGLRAEGAGRWGEALAAYRRAVALQPKPGPRVITYGMNLLENYWPYQRMARCQLELGELEAAAALLRQSSSLGEPAGEPARLRQRLEDLRRRNEAPRAELSASKLQEPRPPAILPEPQPLAAQPKAPEPRTPLEHVQPEPPKAESPKAETPFPKEPEPQAKAQEPSPAENAPANPVPSAGAPPSPPPDRAWMAWSGGAVLALLAALGLRLLRRRRARVSALPRRIGPYRILGVLGSGGFATTYEARKARGGEIVALKVPHPHILFHPSHLHRFQKEANLGLTLEHPRLARTLGLGWEEDRPYLVMEYLEGTTLAQRLARGALPRAQALATAAEVSEALAYAHARGIIHRDLKPGNVLLTDSGAKVLDFGIARTLADSTSTTTQAFLGTPLYAAPEVLLGQPAGPAADLYGLGAILYEMLAGAPPHAGADPITLVGIHSRGEGPDLAHIPEDLRGMVRALLDPDPRRRPTAQGLGMVLSLES